MIRALAEATDPAAFGGKAVQLGTAIRAGLPVPASGPLPARHSFGCTGVRTRLAQRAGGPAGERWSWNPPPFGRMPGDDPVATSDRIPRVVISL